MIRFDNFSCLNKLLQGEIFSEINKVTMIEDQYGLENYSQTLLNTVTEYFGVKFAVILNSRMLGLQLVLNALNCGCSDEVILSTYNPVEAASAVKNIGANPVFVDINNNDLSMDEKTVPLRITPRTKAVIYTGIPGSISDNKRIRNISDKYKVPVIEYVNDVVLSNLHADTLGESGVICVNFIASSSFGVGGEVSILLLNNKGIYDRLIDALDFPMVYDYNYRKAVAPVILDPVSAAVFKIKFDHIGLLDKKIAKITNIYKKNLPRDVYLGQNYILIEDSRRLIEFMERKEIEVRRGYSCLHLNDGCVSESRDESLARAEEISSNVFRLPMHAFLSEKEAKYVCENINHYLQYRPIHDCHNRKKNGKLTFVKDNEVVSIFEDRQAYLNTRKGYDYFSKIADVPRVIFKEEDDRMIMISEFIHDEKFGMPHGEVLRRMGKLLAGFHRKSRVGVTGTVYDFLISRNYQPKHAEIVGLIKKYKAHFRDQYVHHIHGDFSSNNLLFASDKIYIVDLAEYCIFDHYSDFASVYLNTCHENGDQFSLFLESYFNGADLNFSYKRFYINVLIRLLDQLDSKYEHKRYPAKISFEYYLNKLLNKDRDFTGESIALRR